MLALNSMFGTGVQFGRDIVFTYGPWGYLDTRCYHPATFRLMLLAWGFFALVFWRTCWLVSRRHISNPGLAFVWLIAVLGLAALGIEATSSSLLFLTGLPVVYFFDTEESRLSPSLALLLAAVALASLVKFSYFVTAALVIGLITIDQFRRRRLPSVLFVFVGIYLALYLLAGQRASSLWTYMSVSFHLAGHYTDAMSYAIGSLWQPTMLSPEVPPLDLFCFLFAASLLLSALVAAEWRRRKWASVLHVTACGGVLFMIYKWGYVRHEFLHAPLATTVLLALTIFYLPVLWSRLPGRHWGWRLGAVASVAAMVCWATVYCSIGEGLLAYFNRALLAQVPSNFTSAIRLTTGTSRLPAEYSAALNEIRNWSPAPAGHGTVDVYPWNQAAAIADGLTYRPRPIFQSYCAYTPQLARMNADYLRGPQAPDEILLDVSGGSALQHFPAADDGPSWPELLIRYHVEEASRAFLLLGKRARPGTYELRPISQVKTGFDAAIAVPPIDDGPIWVQITIEPTAAGRLLSLAYKNPELMMAVSLPAGQEQVYRLIAGEAEAGFLLSPLVDNRQAFAALASSQWRQRLRDKQLTTIRLSNRGWIGTRWAYRPDVLIKFYRLHFESSAGEPRFAGSAESMSFR